MKQIPTLGFFFNCDLKPARKKTTVLVLGGTNVVLIKCRHRTAVGLELLKSDTVYTETMEGWGTLPDLDNT